MRKKRLFKARRALSEESGKGSVSRCRRMKKRSSGDSGGWEGKVHKVNNEKKIYRCFEMRIKKWKVHNGFQEGRCIHIWNH